MKKLTSCIAVLAFLGLACTTYHPYNEFTHPGYTKPDPKLSYHCETPKDCNKYFATLCYHAALTNEPQRVNYKDHRGVVRRGKIFIEQQASTRNSKYVLVEDMKWFMNYEEEAEKFASLNDEEYLEHLKQKWLADSLKKGELVVFEGSIYYPELREWFSNVKLAYPMGKIADTIE